MPRKQFLYTFEESFPGQAELKCEVVLKAFDVRFNSVDERQECFHFGGEIKGIAGGHVVEGLYPEPVASAKQFPPRFVPKRESKHPPQVRDAIFSPATVSREDHLSVRGGFEILRAEL